MVWLRGALVMLVLMAGLSPARASTLTNLTLPTVSGAAVVDQTLTADPGTWSSAEVTFEYAWFRSGERIRGARSATYVVAAADVGQPLSVRVRATDTTPQTVTAWSTPTAPVSKADYDAVGTVKLDGTRRFTYTLTARLQGWAPDPEPSYRWLRDGEPIAGATSARYELSHLDVGHRISVRVVSRRPGYVKTEVTSGETMEIRHRIDVRRRVSYVVVTRGTITADVALFKKLVAETYADPRGWRNAGVEFTRVASGGDFTVVLAEASLVPTYHPICSSMYSCRVGRYVIINQTRWQTGTPAFTLGLRDYRHMVLNHETGHWLNHRHAYCAGPGLPAPVMQQQSISLQGCRPNPWPLKRELWVG